MKRSSNFSNGKESSLARTYQGKASFRVCRELTDGHFQDGERLRTLKVNWPYAASGNKNNRLDAIYPPH